MNLVPLKRQLLRRLFWPLLAIVLAASLIVLLWSGRAENVSYRDMACAFEELAPGCVDSLEKWNAGLAFFDSSVSVSHDTVGALKSLLWDFWKIEFAGAGDASVAHDAVLPLRVLERGKSGCMGLSWLALMVAEARSLPLNAILLPAHVFLRYGDSLNLEPNRRGHFYTDEEYREKYKDGPWTGLEFRPLKAREFVGLAAFDIGNLYLESEPRRALTWYRMAEEFFGAYPGIAANQNVAKNHLPDEL